MRNTYIDVEGDMSEENNLTLDAKELELVGEETERYIQDQVPWERVKRLITKT